MVIGSRATIGESGFSTGLGMGASRGASAGGALHGKSGTFIASTLLDVCCEVG